MSEIISCSFEIGNECTFYSSWQGKNLILPHSKLYFLLDGEIFIEVNGKSYVAKKNDLVLIPANVVHSCSLTDIKYMKKDWCHFTMKKGNKDFFENLKFPYIIEVKDVDYVKSLFGNLFSLQNAKPLEKDIMSSATICKIVSYFLENCSVEIIETQKDEIDDCINYINENYTEEITIEQLAEISNYSLNYFIKKFKQKTGTTPIKFINTVRLNAVCQLLKDTDLTINEIMHKTGFLDQAYFTKLFKKNIGYSPMKFRKLQSN